MILKEKTSKIWIAFMLSIFFYNLNFAQVNETKNYIKISLASTNYFPLQIKTQGVKLLESQISPSAELGIAYSRSLPYKWSVECGISYSQISYNFYYNFYSKRFDNPQVDDLNNFNRLTQLDYRSARLTLNIASFKDFTISNTNFLRTYFGFNINALHSESVETNVLYENMNLKEYVLFTSYVESFSPIRIHFSYISKIGIVKKFKNEDNFTFSLVGCYAPTAILNGNFEFYNIEYQSKGTLKLRPSYFGLEFNYAFALKKKK